ncbi:MAG TPA: hypothetical protein VHM26_06910 [Chitinophagaceae bacterium]|jgi:hypothetical protein|nr:hypothetical protein [Chitinophagaceae bacterium]
MATSQQITDDPYAELDLFYRDCNVEESIIDKYVPGKLLIEPLPALVTSNAGGLTKTVRFCIAAKNLNKRFAPGDHPDKWDIWSLPPLACFKIMDRYEIDGQWQVLLMHIPDEDPSEFYHNDVSIAPVLIDKARMDFDKKVDADINMALEEEEWKNATAAPIGLTPEGEYNILPPIRRHIGKMIIGADPTVNMILDDRLPTLLRETFSQVALFIRDTDLDEKLVSKYEVGQLLAERGFTDMSYKQSGMAKRVRFAIVSNRAADLSQMDPNAARYGFAVLPNDSLFKVIDIYEVKGKKQVMLLHFPTYGAGIMQHAQPEAVETIVEQVRKQFDDSLNATPLPDLQEEEWVQRTAFPIGMNDEGEFFLQ